MSIYLFMMMIVLLYGSFQVKGILDFSHSSARVVCLSGLPWGSDSSFEDEYSYRLNETTNLAKVNSDIVIWSEKMMRISTLTERDKLWTQARNISATYAKYIGIAYEDFVDAPTNTKGKSMFVMFDKAGNVGFEYQKAHPKPRAENNILPGPSNQPATGRELSLNSGLIGGATEFDLNFHTFSKSIKQQNINLLISLTASKGNIRLGTAIQAFRAMEQGITILSCGGRGAIASSYYNPL
ncbi:hypothetical protein BX616_008104, partial [Lobosporangium transversale]